MPGRPPTRDVLTSGQRASRCVRARRWTWNQQQGRGAESIKMQPTLAGGIGFYVAAIEVPKEAWGVDMVFIDTDDVRRPPDPGHMHFERCARRLPK